MIFVCRRLPANEKIHTSRCPPSGAEALRAGGCDSVVNIFYPFIAIPADISEDVPYVIIFMKACT